MRLLAAGRELDIRSRPLLMGIVNASPDSFSDGGAFPTLADQVARGRALVEAGADILDVGGESARGDAPQVAAADEIARVVPLIRELAGAGAVISVDTHKPEVAREAVAAGAAIVNDVSGLRDEALASVCAASGAALVITHTRVAPKGTLLDPGRYEDVVADVCAFLRERMDVALGLGVAEDQLILDPGPDFAKTPAQTVEVLRRLPEVAALGRPLLLAVSRKDFLGAITGRAAPDRDAATLAAVEAGVSGGAAILRVHDVAAARDYLAVRAVLRGERSLAPDDGLGPERFPGVDHSY